MVLIFALDLMPAGPVWAADLIDNEGSTVPDNDTGLTWLKDAVYADLNASVDTTWQGALTKLNTMADDFVVPVSGVDRNDPPRVVFARNYGKIEEFPNDI